MFYFGTTGDVSFGFQSKSGFCLIRIAEANVNPLFSLCSTDADNLILGEGPSAEMNSGDWGWRTGIQDSKYLNLQATGVAFTDTTGNVITTLKL